MPLVIVSRWAAYAAKMPRDVYDDLALSGSSIGWRLRTPTFTPTLTLTPTPTPTPTPTLTLPKPDPNSDPNPNPNPDPNPDQVAAAQRTAR